MGATLPQCFIFNDRAAKIIKLVSLAMKIIKTHTLTTSSGLTLNYILIPIEEGRNLVETGHGKLLEQFSSSYCESYFYLLNDSRVVHLPVSLEATIYEPYEAFLSYMEDFPMKRIPYSYPIPRVKRLPGGRKIHFTAIDKDELDGLRTGAEPLDKLQRSYLLQDGRVLIDNTMTGEVYGNADDYKAVYDFKALYNDFLQRKLAGEYAGLLTWGLCGLNPFGKDFPAHVDELAAKLPALLGAPAEIFDGREQSLSEIEKFLYRRTITDEFQEQAFLPLLAYAGKTYIARQGGEWVMLYDEASDLWLPDIRQSDGEMKMVYHPLSVILNPEEGQGMFIPLQEVYEHTASNPGSW
jgi:hypothetical protein